MLTLFSYSHGSNSDDNNTGVEDVTATSTSPLGLLTSDSYGRDVLDLMFMVRKYHHYDLI